MTRATWSAAEARGRLADAPREALGREAVPRRILGIARAPRILPVGEAWHLGALLLPTTPLDGADLLATGEIVRARTEAIRGYAAQSQRRRAERAAAAARGGFPDGATVHVDWHPVDPAAPESPLAIADGVVVVRWSRTAPPMPLGDYLAERIALLLDPPRGAT